MISDYACMHEHVCVCVCVCVCMRSHSRDLCEIQDSEVFPLYCLLETF